MTTLIPGTFPSTIDSSRCTLSRESSRTGEELNESKTADSDGHRLRRESSLRYRVCVMTDLGRVIELLGRP
jgi:hypothetical protein